MPTAVTCSSESLAFTPDMSLSAEEALSKDDMIRDIEQVMRLKQNELGSLHERFGSQRHPPSMYIQLYANLNDELVKLQSDLQKLMDEEESKNYSHQQTGDQPDPQTAQPSDHPSNTFSYSQSEPGATYSVDPRSGHSDPASPSYNVGGGGSSSHSDDDSRQTPLASEANPTITAFLPNAQRTVFKAQHGLTLRGALAKRLQRRSLETSDCRVIRTHDKLQVSWDIQTSELVGHDITVVLSHPPNEAFDIIFRPGKPHEWARFIFDISYCEVCNKIIAQGMRCRNCNKKCHRSCIHRIPAHCNRTTIIPEKPSNPNRESEEWKQ